PALQRKRHSAGAPNSALNPGNGGEPGGGGADPAALGGHGRYPPRPREAACRIHAGGGTPDPGRARQPHAAGAERRVVASGAESEDQEVSGAVATIFPISYTFSLLSCIFLYAFLPLQGKARDELP